MSRYLTSKLLLVLLAISLSACQTIPEWDKTMIDNPVEDGRCPDLSGRFNYEHLGANNTRELVSILSDTLTNNLPDDDHATPEDFKELVAINMRIYKGRYLDAYPGTVIATLTRLDQMGRKYHVRVDWDLEGFLGEYDFKIGDGWICSGGNLFRSTKSTLHEDSSPREIDPKDYRRIYVLPNGNIRIDRKHTFIPQYLKDQNELFRYYESRVFAKIQK
ncbi:MAG: hypothetical protein ABI265_10020 [Gallionella sp.]